MISIEQQSLGETTIDTISGFEFVLESFAAAVAQAELLALIQCVVLIVSDVVAIVFDVIKREESRRVILSVVVATKLEIGHTSFGPVDVVLDLVSR